MKNARFKYGQQASDFDEGVLFFMSPGQVFGMDIDKQCVIHLPEAEIILIRSGFLQNTPLLKR